MLFFMNCGALRRQERMTVSPARQNRTTVRCMDGGLDPLRLALRTLGR